MKIPYDDYNSHIRFDGTVCTITAQSPRTAFRQGQKIIEVYEKDDEGVL